MSETPVSIEVNGRSDNRMRRPVVVFCVDGCAYEYLEMAAARAAPIPGKPRRTASTT